MISDSYFDRFTTAKYRNPNPLQRALIRKFVTQFHSLFIAAQPAETILEIGVGEGFLSGYLSEKFPQKHFVGVDLDETKLAALGRIFHKIESHKKSIYDLGFQEGSFDLVICAEVLEHVDRPMEALDEILRLKPKHVLVSVPNEPWFCLSNFLRGKNVTRLGNDIEHVNLWSVSAFRALLEKRFDILTHTTSYPWQLALLAPR